MKRWLRIFQNEEVLDDRCGQWPALAHFGATSSTGVDDLPLKGGEWERHAAAVATAKAKIERRQREF